MPSLALCVRPAFYLVYCCRFEADAVVFLHDDQPHADYWPTKVCYLLVLVLVLVPHHSQSVCRCTPQQHNCISAANCVLREVLCAHAGQHPVSNRMADGELPAIGFLVLQLFWAWLPAPPP